MTNVEVAGLDWSTERLVPSFQAPQHLDVYDIRHASHDGQLSAVTMAGIINRPQPRVYLITVDDDAFWLQQVANSVSQDTATVSGDEVTESLLIAYRSSVQGIIIYDPNLVDSINVATTMAGQRNGFVVSPKQANDLKSAYDLPILADLRTHAWKTRLQAYDWARQNLLNGSSKRLVAGLEPSNMGGLRSFLVATRSFIYWLDSRTYLPDLSDGLLSERSLMQQILGAYPAGAAHLGWFIDESSGVNLTSQAALPVLATNFFFNLECWSAIQPQALVSTLTQADVTTPTGKTMYVSFTISDGDNLQYSQHRMLALWKDKNRGSIPIGWTISPVLAQAAPAIADYYKTTVTANDELLAGPSGAGYMFPSHWPKGHLVTFLQQTGQLMQAMNLSILVVLDTDFWQSSGLPFVANIRQTGMAFTDAASQQSYVRALTHYGLKGILSGSGLSKVDWKKVNGVLLYQNLGLADSVEGTVKLIKNAVAAHTQRPLFLNVYILAWKMTPTALTQVVQQLGSGYEIVLPSTVLAGLAKTL